MAGYVVALADDGPPVARQTWMLTADSQILALEKYDRGAQMQSHVKVQGDRSMRFRVLNPNLALVVSGAADGAPSSHLGTSLLAHISCTLEHQISLLCPLTTS